MIVLILAAVFIAIIILILKNNNDGYDDYDDIFSPQKAAGRRGEAKASGMIKSILDNSDFLITGLHLIYDGQKAEFDNIMIKGTSKNSLPQTGSICFPSFVIKILDRWDFLSAEFLFRLMKKSLCV